MEAQLALLVGAPFEESRFLVRGEAVEGAAHDEIARARAGGVDMEIVEIGPDIIVAAAPQHIADRIDDRGLASVVGPDEDVEARREREAKRRRRREATKTVAKISEIYTAIPPLLA